MPSSAPIPGKFEQDPRAHVDKTTGKWQYEDEEDGQEYEWTGKAWIPLVRSAARLLCHSCPANPVPCSLTMVLSKRSSQRTLSPVSTKMKVTMRRERPRVSALIIEQVPAAPVLAREDKIKKRKAGEKDSGRESRPTKSQATAPKKTGVWVTNLPPNTTVELLRSTFSKAGVLHVDDNGNPRIKLYYDENGNFKGEALIMYFKEGSVDLAITLLDDTELELGAGYGNMRVRVAEYDRAKPTTAETTSDAAGNAAEPSQKKTLSAEAKQRMTKRMRTLQKYVLSALKDLADFSKLAWHSDDDDDDEGIGRRASRASESKFARVVVLKGMFRRQELEEEPELLIELKEDVREEAETLGVVTSVVLYDVSPTSPLRLADVVEGG